VSQVRIALAGLGAAARQIHLPAYAGLRGLEVVGGADPAVGRGRFPFPVFASAEEMLDRVKPDVLAVLAPPDAHFALAALGLRAGCHVFLEKPAVPTLEAADDLCALAREAGRTVVVNQEYRFMNIHEETRRRIGRPEFGDLLFLSAEQTFFVTAATEAGWRGQGETRTGQEFGVHVLDLCRFFFGEEPRAVTAVMPRPLASSGPDLLNLIRLDFPRDRVAHIVLDRLSRGRHRYLRLRLDGTAGCIETRIGGGVELRAGFAGAPRRRPYAGIDISGGGRARLYHGEAFRKIASDPLDLFAAATRRLLEAALAAWARGETPPCEIHDNRRTLALLVKSYESSRRRETVTV
jgi:predicted dehydrogenase